MLIYLAGAITYFEKANQLDYAILWRKIAKDNLKDINIDTFDPTLNYTQNKEYNLKGIPYQNSYYLQKSDIILVNLDMLKESPGTLWEIFIGWYLQKPIITFGESDLVNQPHVAEAITIKFNKLTEATEYIKSMYCQ